MANFTVMEGTYLLSQAKSIKGTLLTIKFKVLEQ